MTDLKKNIEEISANIPENVTLVAVSKFHPVEVLQQAYDLGLRVFGESRAQEIRGKHEALPKDIEWHFIGHLQTNKVRMLVPYVTLFHSVDSENLLKVINDESARINKVSRVLLQLHVAEEETKFGFDAGDCMKLAESGALEKYPNVKICGVMGMATNTDDEAEVRKEFKTVKSIFDLLKEKIFKNDDSFTIISMGMSGDYKIAIEEGSNMVRIGTSIFGKREY